jgi:type II restriction enzyme
LQPYKANTPAKDFSCPECEERFQLKSQKKPLTTRMQDSAYSKMAEAIRMDETPNFFGLHYDQEEWLVRNLLLIPRFVLSLSAVHKRKPLSPNAERHGWVGCDILLDAIPTDARIPVVVEGVASKPKDVREQFESLKSLGKRPVEARGWVMDVWRVVQRLGKEEFELPEVYAAEKELAKLHPDNRYIQPKIRQQLQVLRDLGFLRFLGRGRYGLT